MNSIKRIVIGVSVVFILHSNIFCYDRNLAADYAKTWWNGRNRDKYKVYDKDCANFVSQCLIGGGFNLSTFKEYMEFTGFDDKGCIYNCDVLADFLTKVVCINCIMFSEGK